MDIERTKVSSICSDKKNRKGILGRGDRMYSFMVLNSMCRRLYRDFLSYYKRNPEDDFYIVSVNNPKLAQYLEEFIERRLN
jgi:hypothetical protein